MQILHWLFKVAQETQTREQNSSSISKKQSVHDQKVKSRDIVPYNDLEARRRRLKHVEQSKLRCKNFNLFYILRRKDIAKACFYHTLNLRRVGSFRKRQHSSHSMKMKKEDIVRGLGIAHKADSNAHVGNKVLPITDAAQSSSSNNEQCPKAEKKEKPKSDPTKAISRMKELLKWAAAAKSEKGGKYLGRKILQFRNRAALKAVPDDDQLSNDSPKISFRWDLETCSTTSSAISGISKASSLRHDQTTNVTSMNSTPIHIRDQTVSRRGSWITTDSEFVVLEL